MEVAMESKTKMHARLLYCPRESNRKKLTPRCRRGKYSTLLARSLTIVTGNIKRARVLSVVPVLIF